MGYCFRTNFNQHLNNFAYLSSPEIDPGNAASHLGFELRLKATAKPVTGISLNTEKKTLKEKESFTLKATVNPADADNRTVKWTSSDKKVAKVTDNGKVTATGAGSCTRRSRSWHGGRTAARCTKSRRRTAISLANASGFTGRCG